MRRLCVLTLLMLFLVVGCSSSPTSKKGDTPTKPRKPFNSLKKEDLKEGTGPEAKRGDVVKVHYTGWLAENGKKFDSSLDRGDPFQFKLGAGMVIQGWDQGVVGMKVGGKRKLMIPSELGYGKSGAPPKIPPDADLLFEVELLEIVK